MTYALHTLVTFGGAIGIGETGGADRWQCGVRVGFDVGDGTLIAAPDLAGFLAVAGPALNTALHTGSGVALLASDCSVDFVKAAQIDTTGKYVAVANNPAIYSPTGTLTGSAGRVGTPMQALKLTWQTALAHGPGHQGGIYVPFIGYAGWNTSSISTQAQTDYRAWGKAILTALHQTVGGATSWPVVASEKTGTLNKITGVKVGNVIDVQRRRKEQVIETYSSTLAFP